MILASSTALPMTDPRWTFVGSVRMYSAYSGVNPWKATYLNFPTIRRNMFALSARQSRAAEPTSVSNTVCRSKVERLMTLSTSAVAVCRSNDCRSSVSSRAFSMAMTAWSANVATNSICLSVKGATR